MEDNGVDSTRSTRNSWRVSRSLAVCLLVGLVLVYRPWANPHFDILDFSEFLPLLRDSRSFLENLVDLTRYYASHGRWATATWSFIAGSWSLFGDWAPGWMLVRVALLLAGVCLGFAFFRCLGFSRRTAAVSMSLYLFSTPAAAATVRMTGEIFAFPALFLSGILAARYQLSDSWRWLAIAIAGLTTYITLAKELILPMGLGMVLLALVWHAPGGLANTLGSRRNRFLVSVTGLVLAPAVARIVWVATHVGPEGYVSAYGSGGLTLDRILFFSIRMFLPVHPLGGSEALFFWSGCLFIALVVGGLVSGRRRVSDGRFRLRWIGLSLLIPLIGCAVYLPWPRMESFYALPYVLGPILLLALSSQAMDEVGSPLASIYRVSRWGLVIMAAAVAFNHVDRTYAQRQLNWRIVETTLSVEADTVVFLGPIRRTRHLWQGTGPTLARYAHAMGVGGRSFPSFRNGHCEELTRDRGGSPSGKATAFLVVNQLCPENGTPVLSLEEPYRRLSFFKPWGTVLALEARFYR